jgi:hypothetical protein
MIPYHKRIDIIWAASIDQGELIALLAINEFLGGDGFCWPGINQLSQMSRCSRSTFKRIMNRLIEKKIIVRKPRFINRAPASNSYFIDFAALQSLPPVQNEPTPRFKMNLPPVHSCEPTPQSIAVNLPPVHSCEPRITNRTTQLLTTEEEDPERAIALSSSSEAIKKNLQADPEKQPTAASTDLEYLPAINTQRLASNPDIEITNIPPASAEISRQESALIPHLVDLPNQQKSGRLQGHVGASKQQEVILATIEVWNNHRGGWAEANLQNLSEKAQNRLYSAFIRQGAELSDFVENIRDSALFLLSEKYYNQPSFTNRNLGFLVQKPDLSQINDYACKWRVKNPAEKIGAALTIRAESTAKQYFDLEGKPMGKTWAKCLWWEISKKAIAGEQISDLEIAWANNYFPGFNIYEGHEWLA